MQLKCRASATHRQPPINKRDYRLTTRRISVQEDCSAQPTSQSEVLLASLLRKSPFSLSLFLSRFTFSLFCPLAPFNSRPLWHCSFSSSRWCLPPVCLSFFLLRLSGTLAHTCTHAPGRSSRQTFCLLPLALTIKRWRRRACAAMFPIPLVLGVSVTSPTAAAAATAVAALLRLWPSSS